MAMHPSGHFLGRIAYGRRAGALSGLFASAGGGPPLQEIVWLGGFDDSGDFLGTHAAIKHVALHVGVKPMAMECGNRTRYATHDRANDTRCAADGDDHQHEPLLRVETKEYVLPGIGRHVGKKWN